MKVESRGEDGGNVKGVGVVEYEGSKIREKEGLCKIDGSGSDGREYLFLGRRCGCVYPRNPQ